MEDLFSPPSFLLLCLFALAPSGGDFFYVLEREPFPPFTDFSARTAIRSLEPRAPETFVGCFETVWHALPPPPCMQPLPPPLLSILRCRFPSDLQLGEILSAFEARGGSEGRRPTLERPRRTRLEMDKLPCLRDPVSRRSESSLSAALIPSWELGSVFFEKALCIPLAVSPLRLPCWPWASPRTPGFLLGFFPARCYVLPPFVWAMPTSRWLFFLSL